MVSGKSLQSLLSRTKVRTLVTLSSNTTKPERWTQETTLMVTSLCFSIDFGYSIDFVGLMVFIFSMTIFELLTEGSACRLKINEYQYILIKKYNDYLEFIFQFGPMIS